MNGFWFKLSLQFFLNNFRSRVAFSFWVAILGLALGVGCLVVSMSVVSGFEQTLVRAISDTSAHIQVRRSMEFAADQQAALEKLKSHLSEPFKAAPALWVESILVHSGLVAGALLQGVPLESVREVLALESRVVAGSFPSKTEDGILIGKGLAKKFSLRPGDFFRLVIPHGTLTDEASFRRRAATFKVAGVLDIGKHEVDERLILLDLKQLQDLAQVGQRTSAILMRFSKPELALEKVFEIEQALGIGFRVLSWRDLSANLFDAIRIERWVIFFVIFIIVAAAAFNLVCALIVSVVQRVSQLSLLRALGAQPMQLTALLALQGLGVGLMGSIIGLGLGVGAAYGFWALQDKLQLISGSVYRLDHIDIAFRYQDMIFILVATLCVCLIAVAAPARMAISQPIAKGLRYE